MRSLSDSQGLVEVGPKRPVQGSLGTLVWSALGAQPSVIAAFIPGQTAHKGEKELWSNSSKLNEAGALAP